MKPEFILKADMLDILFENRNKEYGAYELRRQYDSRLKKAMAIIFSTLILVITTGYLKNHFSPDHRSGQMVPVIDSLVVTSIPIPKDPLPPVPAAKKVATLKDVTLRIVPDKLLDSTKIATLEEKTAKNIGTQDIDGPLPGDNAPQSSNGNGAGDAPAIQSEAPAEDNNILGIAEFMPEFPGGLPALQRFLSRNLRTPREDMEPGSKIRVLARFVVDKDGSITGIDIEQSGGHDFDNEVTRVIKKMPAWKPGKQNGRNVAVYFKMPVVFLAQDDH